jgi:2-isopropylmalate synthase
METIRIFDTTLRDGEQSPGCSMSAKEKLLLARQLDRLGVDVIEAGFAASSSGDFESVRQIGQQINRAKVVSLCRASLSDIERAVDALKESENWGIHIFIASSQLHMKYKLQMDEDEVLKRSIEAVEFARKHTDYVEFSAEDATRSEPQFLVKLFSAVVRAGATTLNVPDTVGYTTPDEMYKLIKLLKNEVYQTDQVVFSVHCHNDLGMGVANSLAAVRAGARQIECTINGIGERAGNAAMEEIVMAIRTRRDHFEDVHTDVITTEIVPISRLVSRTMALLAATGIPIVRLTNRLIGTISVVMTSV